MSDLHALGIRSASREILEEVGADFVKAGLLQARESTINAVRSLSALIQEGMTEDEARKAALQLFADLGVSKHWHRPFVRFGPGTLLTFDDPIQPDYRIQSGDPFYVDVGPVWRDSATLIEYEGDYGETFVFGENPEASACIQAGRDLFSEMVAFWNQQQRSGRELYAELSRRTKERGYTLVAGVEGHRVSDFPHHRYTKESLSKTDFAPTPALWVLEVQIAEPQKRFGAFYEDLLI